MKPASDFKNPGLRFVFTDIDDTLTEGGQLVPSAFDAIWKLHRSGLNVIPVTGRPAGWCELIARQWPVSGVVGENGGFYFRYHDKQMKRVFFNTEAERVVNSKKLEAVQQDILKSVPGSAVASDQFCRLMDLAIDFCEDVPALSPVAVNDIVSIFVRHGAQAKVSSIHVNGWFGDYNKLSMCKTFLQNEFGFDMASNNLSCMFVGDSPNDEPMFEFFQNSFGVANVKHFEKQMKTLPRFISSAAGGAGFAEIAGCILK